MSDGWIPYDYLDETIPPFRASPTDWLGRFDDGAPGLLDWDGEVAERRLEDGAVVFFIEHRSHGEATLTVAADGTWTVDRPMPEAASEVWCPEIEHGGKDIATLIKDWTTAAEAGSASTFAESGPVTIYYGWWSDKSAFSFDAAAHCMVAVPAATAQLEDRLANDLDEGA